MHAGQPDIEFETSPPVKPRAIILCDDWACAQVYGGELRDELARRVEFATAPLSGLQIAAHPEALRDVEIIFTSWGTPRFDAALLAAAPKLRAVFHGAGSIKAIMSDAFWARGITITSAYSANAIPVAEFTLSTILFSLKHGWRYALGMQRERRYLPKTESAPGAFRSTVGLISLGMVGRRVAELLRITDVRIIACDPFCTRSDAAALGVELVPLGEIFARAHVVSLHTPLLPETEGMITGAHFDMMSVGATFINTARGAVVRETEMIEVLQRRPDLTAVLDVTWPDPPALDSPLFTLPNVVLTPHIAGASDGECRRLGYCMLEELDRYLAVQPLRWAITREKCAQMA